MQNKQKPSLDDECVLCSEKRIGRDSVGNAITETVEREVWCAETPTPSNEVERARQRKISAEVVLVLDASEYQGEGVVRVDSRTLSIYRTYQRPDGMIELYAGQKVGVVDGKDS